MQLWKRNTWCLAVIFLVFVIGSSLVCAIQITEVELNPEGDDSGNEWIEFYSKNEINLEDYKLVDNDGDELLLSGSFSGYYVYTHDKRWFDNVDEIIYLYNGENLIDEIDLLKDDKNDGRTWQDCDGWIFDESSKGSENNCEVEEPEMAEEESDNAENIEYSLSEAGEESSIDESNIINSENQDSEENLVGSIGEVDNGDEMIYLTLPKNIKSLENKEVLFKSANEKIKEYAIYGFALFCVLIIILLLIDKYR